MFAPLPNSHSPTATWGATCASERIVRSSNPKTERLYREKGIGDGSGLQAWRYSTEVPRTTHGSDGVVQCGVCERRLLKTSLIELSTFIAANRPRNCQSPNCLPVFPVRSAERQGSNRCLAGSLCCGIKHCLREARRDYRHATFFVEFSPKYCFI